MKPNDRDAILTRVRSALATLPQRAPAPDYDLAKVLARKGAASGDLFELFSQRMSRLDGIVITDPAELAKRLKAGGWTKGYCDPAVWPLLAPYFEGLEVSGEYDRSRVDDYSFGVTRAAGAIAETGSVILNDATTSRRLGALAPWVHVAVVEASQIHADIPQAIAALGDDPNTIWCTGPSRTADVEGILIKGVHGPGIQIALVLR